MKYAKIKYNDVANAPGVCVSLYVQGCPHHCYNCFNPETWDENGGQEFTNKTMSDIIEGIGKFGVKRDFCILGGEPLAPYNDEEVFHIASTVKFCYPNIKIFIWTGYTFEQLQTRYKEQISEKLKDIDVIVDGPYLDAIRDITLHMRGSGNQRIIDVKETLEKGSIIEW